MGLDKLIREDKAAGRSVKVDGRMGHQPLLYGKEDRHVAVLSSHQGLQGPSPLGSTKPDSGSELPWSLLSSVGRVTCGH